MKYKAGDKVRVRKDLNEGTRYGELTAYGLHIESKGMAVTINGTRDGDYFVLESNMIFSEGMLEPCTFTKSDLMTGDVVEMANGKRFLTLLNTANGDVFSNHREYNSFKNVNEDLTNGITKQCDIVKVFRATNNYQTKFDRWDEMPLIWEYEKPIVEITLEEIAKLKGMEVSQIRIKDGEL